MRPVVSRMRLCVLLWTVLVPRVAAAAEGGMRVAVAPVERVNLAEAEGQRYWRLLLQVLREAPGVEPAAKEARTSCDLRERACLRRLHRQLKADRLVILRVGRLGDTTVTRLTVFDLWQGTRHGTWQEVLRATQHDRGIVEAMQRMVAAFTPPPPNAARPWYTRWWVWTAAGVVVAGAVTAAVLATRPSDDGYDRSIVPPSP
jgi:hypothetical protein